VVEQARRARGCLDFALSPDTLDPRRVNVFERWSSDEELQRFRGDGPRPDLAGRIHQADVRRYLISGTGDP
jgi:hypothetical protein